MRRELQFLVQYVPMPLCATLGLYQLTMPVMICGGGWDMMSIMWFVMSVSHSGAYIQLLK